MQRPLKVTSGSPEKLGAYWDGKGTNFALFSANGRKVELCLFDPSGQHETARITLPGRSGDIWHGYVEGLKPGQLYGYRVHGPYEPHNGHRFNPNKLLLDPYAREFGGEFKWDDSHYGFTPGHPDGDRSFDTRDNAAFMIKAKVPLPGANAPAAGPATSWQDTIIYEAHVRGLTMDNPAVPAPIRGSFTGAAHKSVIRHLKNLGVTSIELLPVQAFFNDHHQEKRGSRNYWGYNTLSFFAPEPRYGDAAQFRAMVGKFRKAGIEVMLDVVYNHTFEGDHLGPTLSLRGIDNASYYRLKPEDKSKYVDHSGCGNTVNTDHPQVRRMILDSLRYWAGEMGVRGFRFDLATILGRNAHGFDHNHPFFREVENDPVLSKVKLVAEPWDIGPHGYQLGNFPSKWQEWNDVFRDNVRGFWHGLLSHAGKIAYAITGSRNHLGGKKSGSSASVNFITAHDGFTLEDLVTFQEKRNYANGENNRDGSGHNISNNHGAEGSTDNPVRAELRQRQKRNFVATLMISEGIPMLLAGDEFGNSQNGNNNAYCQDNKDGWVNFGKADTPEGRTMTDFTRKVVALRKQYAEILNPRTPFDGGVKDASGVKHITWYSAAGIEMIRGEQWDNPRGSTLGILFNGAARGVGDPADNRLLVIFNTHSCDICYSLPQIPAIKGWERILDTSAPQVDPGQDKTIYGFGTQSGYRMPAKSLIVFRPVPGL